ncbi:MAG: hypothetical protein LAO19_04990 [Acidobacteriia bacterium]|nr:hypothetical protein [Terriglobia bacterium]
MLRLASMMATAALLLSADVPGVMRMRPASQPVVFPSDASLPVLPDMSPAKDGTQPAQKNSQNKSQNNSQNATPNSGSAPAKGRDSRLQPESRLALVRFVDGEFARVLQPIPAGKKGLHVKAGASVDDHVLHATLGTAGSAINPGDSAQITSLEFKDRQIVVDINGGGRGKTKLRDRIHMEVGGMPTMTTSQGPVNTNAGATVYLDFDGPLPDMTPEDLKQYLSSVLDFSRQHSAAVQWIDTLPPEIQSAIADKRPTVGMDHEMVLAALGRPDRKVREKQPDGTESEDWIYGKPPAKTVFVKFEGDKVTQVEQFPQ